MIVYIATNKINGKSYIGQTQKSLNDRISKHFYSVRHNSNLYFHNALRKYDFDWSILEECKSKTDLDMREGYYIEQYNTLKDGYNLTQGGEGSFGYKHSDETRKKMSEIAKSLPSNFKGKKHTEETKEKIRKAKLGQKVHSEEWKKKMSEAHTGENNPFYGKHHTKEVKEKMLNGLKNYYKTITKEQRKKLSEAVKKSWKKRKGE